MPAPVVEQIARKLKTRLEQCTLANGYAFDAVVVRPGRKEGAFVPRDKEVVLKQWDREQDLENSVQRGAVYVPAWWQIFGIAVFAMPSETSTTPLDEQINVYEAEVMRAITTPETPGDEWSNFDGLAVNAAFGQPDQFPPNGEIAGQVIALRVLYRHPETDPYTPVLG